MLQQSNATLMARNSTLVDSLSSSASDIRHSPPLLSTNEKEEQIESLSDNAESNLKNSNDAIKKNESAAVLSLSASESNKPLIDQLPDSRQDSGHCSPELGDVQLSVYPMTKLHEDVSKEMQQNSQPPCMSLKSLDTSAQALPLLLSPKLPTQPASPPEDEQHQCLNSKSNSTSCISTTEPSDLLMHLSMSVIKDDQQAPKSSLNENNNQDVSLISTEMMEETAQLVKSDDFFILSATSIKDNDNSVVVPSASSSSSCAPPPQLQACNATDEELSNSPDDNGLRLNSPPPLTRLPTPDPTANSPSTNTETIFSSEELELHQQPKRIGSSTEGESEDEDIGNCDIIDGIMFLHFETEQEMNKFTEKHEQELKSLQLKYSEAPTRSGMPRSGRGRNISARGGSRGGCSSRVNKIREQLTPQSIGFNLSKTRGRRKSNKFIRQSFQLKDEEDEAGQSTGFDETLDTERPILNVGKRGRRRRRKIPIDSKPEFPARTFDLSFTCDDLDSFLEASVDAYTDNHGTINNNDNQENLITQMNSNVKRNKHAENAVTPVSSISRTVISSTPNRMYSRPSSSLRNDSPLPTFNFVPSETVSSTPVVARKRGRPKKNHATASLTPVPVPAVKSNNKLIPKIVVSASTPNKKRRALSLVNRTTDELKNVGSRFSNQLFNRLVNNSRPPRPEPIDQFKLISMEDTYPRFALSTLNVNNIVILDRDAKIDCVDEDTILAKDENKCENVEEPVVLNEEQTLGPESHFIEEKSSQVEVSISEIIKNNNEVTPTVVADLDERSTDPKAPVLKRKKCDTRSESPDISRLISKHSKRDIRLPARYHSSGLLVGSSWVLPQLDSDADNGRDSPARHRLVKRTRKLGLLGKTLGSPSGKPRSFNLEDSLIVRGQDLSNSTFSNNTSSGSVSITCKTVSGSVANKNQPIINDSRSVLQLLLKSKNDKPINMMVSTSRKPTETYSTSTRSTAPEHVLETLKNSTRDYTRNPNRKLLQFPQTTATNISINSKASNLHTNFLNDMPKDSESVAHRTPASNSETSIQPKNLISEIEPSVVGIHPQTLPITSASKRIAPLSVKEFKVAKLKELYRELFYANHPEYRSFYSKRMIKPRVKKVEALSEGLNTLCMLKRQDFYMSRMQKLLQLWNRQLQICLSNICESQVPLTEFEQESIQKVILSYKDVILRNVDMLLERMDKTPFEPDLQLEQTLNALVQQQLHNKREIKSNNGSSSKSLIGRNYDGSKLVKKSSNKSKHSKKLHKKSKLAAKRKKSASIASNDKHSVSENVNAFDLNGSEMEKIPKSKSTCSPMSESENSSVLPISRCQSVSFESEHENFKEIVTQVNEQDGVREGSDGGQDKGEDEENEDEDRQEILIPIKEDNSGDGVVNLVPQMESCSNFSVVSSVKRPSSPNAPISPQKKNSLLSRKSTVQLQKETILLQREQQQLTDELLRQQEEKLALCFKIKQQKRLKKKAQKRAFAGESLISSFSSKSFAPITSSVSQSINGFSQKSIFQNLNTLVSTAHSPGVITLKLTGNSLHTTAVPYIPMQTVGLTSVAQPQFSTIITANSGPFITTTNTTALQHPIVSLQTPPILQNQQPVLTYCLEPKKFVPLTVTSQPQTTISSISNSMTTQSSSGMTPVSTITSNPNITAHMKQFPKILPKGGDARTIKLSPVTLVQQSIQIIPSPNLIVPLSIARSQSFSTAHLTNTPTFTGSLSNNFGEQSFVKLNPQILSSQPMAHALQPTEMATLQHTQCKNQ